MVVELVTLFIVFAALLCWVGWELWSVRDVMKEDDWNDGSGAS